MNKNEIEICEFEMHLKNSSFLCALSNGDNFCLKARSENGYGFYRSGLKTDMENDIFCLK